MRRNSISEFAKRFKKPFSRPGELATVVLRYTLHSLRLLCFALTHHSGRQQRELGIVPRVPLPLYTIWGVAQILGLKLVPRPCAKTLLWLDLTKILPERTSEASLRYINGNCLDISKTKVGEVFGTVFGRALAVDPTTYGGLLVEKSETNGVHDGRIVKGPLTEAKEGCSYQRFVDNTTGEGYVEDLRVLIVGNTLPLVYRKRRLATRRFESSSITAHVELPDQVFSTTEQEQILSFSRVLGLDFGELDVLRDKESQEIYIVDANKTSISPPISMSYENRLKALHLTADAFQKELL